MKNLLQEEEVHIVTAQSGNEALVLLLRHEFAVVLMDVMMPEMDGFETIELMRSHEEIRDTPVIFLTAINKEDQQISKGYATGAVDYIFKPFNPDILKSKVRVFIKLHQAMERNRLQARMLDAVGQGVIATDLNNKIVYWNQAASTMFGWHPDEVLGRDIVELAVPRIEQHQAAEIMAALARGERWSGEFPVRCKNGNVLNVLATNAPVFDKQGKFIGVIGVSADITERKEAEERIKASLQEKEVLLKEIHHRVKNNLQVISSLINLQANSLDDPTLSAPFQDVRDRIRSMALVHEKLYQSESLAGVDFAEYTSSLLDYLWRAHDSSLSRVRLNRELQSVSISVETAVPCGLILNELVSNALKHAFQGRTEGEVTVTLRQALNGLICLRVSDNGTGLPPGLDWWQAPTLGLRLVKMLAGQLNGSLGVKSGEGTEFQLTFTNPQQLKGKVGKRQGDNLPRH